MCAGLFFYSSTQNLPFRFLSSLLVSFLAISVCSQLLVNTGIKPTQKELPHKFSLKVSLLLMISYLICLITYFPGVGMNDGLNIMRSGMLSSNQFPPVYCAFITLLTKIGYLFGSLNISVALYSILQLTCVALITSQITLWIWEISPLKIIRFVSLIFYALDPLIVMYSISMLKDTLFSLLLVPFMILNYKLVVYKKNAINKRYWISLALIACGIIFLRNNGQYIVIPCLFILIIKFRKNLLNKSLIIVFILSISSIVLNFLLMQHWGEKQLFQEVVGIPIQQVAATVASSDGVINDEQKIFLNKIMPFDKIRENYNPATVDTIKWSTAFNSSFFESHKTKFMKVWISLLIPNFMIYLKSYLEQTYWFWAPRQEGTVQCYFSIETYSNNDWLITFTKENDIHDVQLLPDWLNLNLRSYYSLASSFLREGVCFWVLFMLFFLTIVPRKNKQSIYFYLPIAFLWITLMISTPVNSSMRYVFAFVYVLPASISLLFTPSPKNTL